MEIDGYLSINILDPLRLVSAFPPLRIRQGWTLVTQQYSDGANAKGFTWAIPADCPQPDLTLTNWPSQSDKPQGAILPMAVIEGSHTAWSYLCASLLARELAELGAVWHGCEWSTHDLYGGTHLKGEWTFTEHRPGSYNPSVAISEQGATVSFYTRTDLGQSRIIRHTDIYSPGSGYQFDSEELVVAYGPPGFVF